MQRRVKLCVMTNRFIILSETERDVMRRQYIGFVFQNFQLLPLLTVFENVELSLNCVASKILR